MKKDKQVCKHFINVTVDSCIYRWVDKITDLQYKNIQ